MDKERINVLLIENEEDELLATRRLLDEAVTVECVAESARCYEEGLSKLLSGAYDVCLVSYRLGPEGGLDLIRTAVQEGCRTPLILLTSRGDRAVDMEAIKAGAADYLVKEELNAETLDRSIRYAQERRRSEARIREQAALLNEAHDSICVYDLDHNLTFWNKGAERMTGWTADDLLADDGGCEQPPDQCLYGADPQKLDEVRRAVLENGKWSGELRQHTKAGKEIIVESRWSLVRGPGGEPQSILVISTDVTERKKLESQFLRSQRMESIGRLVGGIAHDLGNLLVPVLLGTEVLMQRHGSSERDRRTIEMIQKSAQRGSDMVKHVLAFARGVESERAVMTLPPVIEEVERITDETFPQDVEVSTKVADDLWAVNADATQIQQVIMNLCVNARDALEDGGRLNVRAENVRLSLGDVPQTLEVEPGAFVCLSVADTGPGIPKDVLDKIFEPFFTTKSDGEGTGLGLSTVFSILKSHGGFVDVESEIGKGTTFYVYLPKADVEQAESGPPPALRRDGEGERILLVDDEEVILGMSKDALEQAGYHVMTAREGAAALRLLAEHDIDVVITDIAMPKMNGLEVIRTIRERASDTCIIAMSGLSDSETEEALQAGADHFLTKPFGTEKLHAALRNVLGRRRHLVS